VSQDVSQIVSLEIAVMAHVKVNQDGHDFAGTQIRLRTTAATPKQLLAGGPGFVLLAEVIDMAEQFD
ncbi:MAG: hypothetical protein KDD43_17425, partial [Bdellovibrionales bacterium]|nr:hypothetical protein [Bdellovibrionales bacterium]